MEAEQLYSVPKEREGPGTQRGTQLCSIHSLRSFTKESLTSVL